DKTYYIYDISDHQEAYAEVGSQAISYTTGVPAVTGAMMVLKGLWKKPGVYNVEEFDPDPFINELAKQGLPWIEDHDPVLPEGM
ncbi:saccharopine dehydrogenase family protein, partial [Candidatus Nomurabacteria bacterium]|nr:saccharopine dehydrogenase family protein [Candidatus Nomurabacteria bacterium]